MHTLSTAPVHLIVADDHTLTRAGLVLLLEQIENVEVVGEAANGEDLVRQAEALEPDLVFTDIGMPRLDGLDAIRRLAVTRPGVRCVVVSMHETAAMVRRAAQAGAAGYVLKNASARELEVAIREVLRRGAYFSPAVATLLLAPSEPGPGDLLTERQVEILRLVAHGRSSKEIANVLQLSPKTVDVHRSRIMDRLEARDVASLTRYAIRTGLLPG
ncbi:MAG TPA: response regulator transcription factor [Ramlibacter sp.]|uniref:response regulator transcription factor n=1 Tax=Ramlibacter sp. TaxID=1917967 RepID=UPI002D7F8EDA|nr:response regulator transcription factor [Ramlibacter sp.]HET8747645.1 response regulator transcription factor [Ramlibacter sp.]